MTESLAGTHPGDVLRLLQARRDGAVPGQPRKDGRKLGLVVEGGGMRGVLSAGSLLALDLMGFRECFDTVYSVSAGSVNAAFFLSGQGALGISVYFDDISSSRFINPWRLWKMVDVDYVYDYVVREVKPLDDNAVRAARAAFYVTATDVDTGRNVLLDAKNPQVPVALYLKASSALPVLYNQSVSIGGHRYMDGGVSAGLPIRYAIEEGCTDLVVLVSRPLAYVTAGPSAFERLVFRAVTGRHHPELYRAWMAASPEREVARRIAQGTQEVSGVNVATIAPDDPLGGVHRTTIVREKLIEGAYQSARATMDLFHFPHDTLDRMFSGFQG